MRDRFPLLLAGGVLLLGTLAWFLTEGARRGGFADRLSTHRSEPDGSRALYLLAQESGLDVTRHQQDLSIIPPKQNLVLLGTRFEDERHEFKREVDGANPDAGADDERDWDADKEEFKARGFNAFRSPSISRKETDKLLDHVRNGATLVYVPASYRDARLLDELGVTLGRGADALALRTLVPAQPTLYTRGVERVEVTVRAFLQLPSGAVPLLVDEKIDEPVAALLPFGQGRVIIIGAPELAMNRALPIADNARFWHSLISAVSKSGPVAFDEYHHGFTGDRSMGEFAARYDLHFAVGQLLLGIVLWALALKRFGRPRAPEAELRVGSTDALFATSRLYREGKHFAHAAGSIVKQLSAELAQKAGVSARSEPVEIIAALEVRGRKDLARALLDVTTAANHADSDTAVEKVAALAALVRKTLQRKEQAA